MPGLYSRLQEIIGEKIFRHKVVFDGDVVFKKHITAYAPVGNEPSWGSPHTHIYDSGNIDPADTNVHELDLSGEYPVGTIGIEGFISMASTTAADYVIVTDATGTIVYGICRAQVANITNDAIFFTPLTATRSIYYMASHARITAARFRSSVYFT